MNVAFNMDCMEAMKEMKDNQFDLAIVDPPYGIGLSAQYKNGLDKNNGSIHDKSKDWNNIPPNEEYFKELHRVSKNQIIWGVNYYSKHIPAVGRIIHDKKMGISETKIRFSEADLASCSLQKRITIFEYRWNGNRQGDKLNWFNTGPDRRIHPTQKPIALYKYCLRNYAKEGDTILDTHLGSGAHRIAAYDLGFDFTGYELDKDYFGDQEKRFKNHISQKRIFDTPKQIAIQEAMNFEKE